VFESIVDTVVSRRRERDQGVMSFFDLEEGLGDDAAGFTDRLPIPDIEYDKSTRLALEKEMLGLYVSDHPLLSARRALGRLTECTVAEFCELDDGSMRTLGGIVTVLARKYTKRGDLMATFTLEDLSASIEAMVFPKTMLAVNELLTADAIVVIKGRLDKREDTPKLIVMDLSRPELHLDAGPPVRLRVRAGAFDSDKVDRLRELIAAHPGDSPFFVHMQGPDKETVIKLPDEFNCDGSNGLHAELRVAFGAYCIL
jgi:DNA polymerase-3 subunit alpha